MPKTPGNTVPQPPIQQLPAKVTALMAAIGPATVEPDGVTRISFLGIDPDNFTDTHRGQVQKLIDKHDLTGVLEIEEQDGCVLLIDKTTRGNRVICNLSLDDEAMGYFSNALVPGEFVYELMVLLAIISDPATANDPAGNGMFMDFSRKSYVLWGKDVSDEYLPFTWMDVKTLLTL